MIFHTRACHVASLSSSIILSHSNNRIFKILIFLVYLQRNQLLAQDAGAKTSLPSAWKTGTTIVGMIYKDGVVLGADTRATGGSEVVDKVRILYLIKVTYPCKIIYLQHTINTIYPILIIELRKNSLSCTQHLVLRCWYSSGHRKDNGAHSLQFRVAEIIHWYSI